MYSLCLVGPCSSSFCFLCCVVFLFCFVFFVLCLVCPQLPVCLDCPFLIVIWFSITYISSFSQICFLTFSEILLFIFAFVFCLFFSDDLCLIYLCIFGYKFNNSPTFCSWNMCNIQAHKATYLLNFQVYLWYMVQCHAYHLIWFSPINQNHSNSFWDKWFTCMIKQA